MQIVPMRGWNLCLWTLDKNLQAFPAYLILTIKHLGRYWVFFSFTKKSIVYYKAVMLIDLVWFWTMAYVGISNVQEIPRCPTEHCK